MAKAAGAQFTMEADSATIGIRGTNFWAGELDGIFQVGLWSGAVVVENRGGGVEINQPNFGTRVADQETPPVEPRPWSETKIQRAQALTSFVLIQGTSDLGWIVLVDLAAGLRRVPHHHPKST